MLLGGIWHGASWNFVVYGGLHGVYLSIHRFFIKNKKPRSERINFFNIVTLSSISFTFFIVTFSRIFFRSTSWKSTELFFSKIIHWESSEYAFWFIGTTLTYLVLIFALDIIEYTTREQAFILNIKSTPFRNGLLTGLFVLTLFFMFQTKTTPFIYFKF
jgi:D-alanyl-lipoteichoic acid acyltransferase DltB (MBOAT superfamily)